MWDSNDFNWTAVNNNIKVLSSTMLQVKNSRILIIDMFTNTHLYTTFTFQNVYPIIYITKLQ